MIQYRKPSGNLHIRPQCPCLNLNFGIGLKYIEKQFKLLNVWVENHFVHYLTCYFLLNVC